MKGFPGKLGIALLALLAVGAAEPVMAFDVGYDYPGGEYLGHHQNVGSAEQCANICRGTSSCVAFTWVRPGVQGNTGVCWLKGSLSNKVRNSCCTSGVVRAVKPDACKWHQQGTTYSCHCRSRQSGKWYQTNPGACTQPKPPPRYTDRRKNHCPPGQRFMDAPFGQGRCVPN